MLLSKAVSILKRKEKYQSDGPNGKVICSDQLPFIWLWWKMAYKLWFLQEDEVPVVTFWRAEKIRMWLQLPEWPLSLQRQALRFPPLHFSPHNLLCMLLFSHLYVLAHRGSKSCYLKIHGQTMWMWKPRWKENLVIWYTRSQILTWWQLALMEIC